MSDLEPVTSVGESAPRPPDGCAVADVVAVVMRLLVERGHAVDACVPSSTAALSAAAGLLLAFDVRPVLDSRPVVTLPHFGLGSGPYHLDGEYR